MWLKKYKSLEGYLERFTVLNISKLHIRIHHILSGDKTPFMHTHPFHYVSIILSGGYTEHLEGKVIHHKRGGIIIRKNTTLHRIHSVLPGTKTLFFTWKTPQHKWTFGKAQYKIEGWVNYKNGVYKRTIFGKEVFAKFDKYWHIGHNNVNDAMLEKNPSIDQTSVGYGVVISMVDCLTVNQEIRVRFPASPQI